MHKFKIYEMTVEGLEDLQSKDNIIKEGIDDIQAMFVQRKPYRAIDGVSYIDVFGPLLRRASELQLKTGITSYEVLARELEQAAQDLTTDRLVLMIDSPGGDAQGSQEITEMVESFPKPVIAYVEGLCASAAYKIASAATEIVSTKSGIIGSIGSVIVVESTKEMANKMGVVRTIFTNSEASSFKGMGQDFGDLSEEQKAYIQSMVEESGVDFKNTVLNNRPEVNDEVFSAKTYNAKKALELGLIDYIF